MQIQSITTLIEAAAARESGVRNASGDVLEPQRLRDPAVLGAFDEAHAGVYAFFAFHPRSDEAVKGYLGRGTVASDAGRHVMALFAVSEAVYASRPLQARLLDGIVHAQFEENALLETARELFGRGARLEFPGVVLIERLSSPGRAVFVSLAGATTADAAAESLRPLFQMAEEAYLEAGDASFAQRLAVKLARANVTYESTDSALAGELLFKALNVISRWRGDIVAALGLVL